MVSLENRCRFCADVHEAVLYGLGLRGAAASMRDRCFESIGNSRLRHAVLWAFSGFGQPAEEWIAAAQSAHFANRVANAMGLRGASRLTPRAMRPWAARRVAGSRLMRPPQLDAAPAALPAVVEQRIRTHVRAWSGEEPGPNRGWVENYLADLSTRDRAAARLALLTALASHQVDRLVRDAFRETYGDPREMEAVIQWGAWLGCRRVMDVTLERVVHAAA